MSIDKLLKPKTVAVVGATDKPSLARSLCANLVKYCTDEQFYFISSSRDEVMGKKCYRALADLPAPVDMVVICIPKAAVPGILDQMAALGIKAGVVLASGYGETGKAEDKQAEKDLADQAARLGLALMGPNCAGFINYVDNVPAFGLPVGFMDRRGGVGVISQSGQICLTMLDMDRLDCSFVISAGNSSVVSLEDYLEYLVNDADTRVIALYMEGSKNPRKFIDVLKLAVSKKKPVVILKAGSSEKGSQIASSHTGSLAGSDGSYDAVFKKYGAIRVGDMEELISMSLLLSTLKELPKSTGFASMNLSGGETGICADMGQQCGVQFPDFQPETMAKLRELLPSYATPNNPLDTTATLSYDPEGYGKLLKTVMDDKNVGMVLCGYTMQNIYVDSCIRSMTQGIELARKSGANKPMAIVSFAESSRDREIITRLKAVGIPVMSSTLYSMRIMKKLADYVDYLNDPPALADAVPTAGAGGKSRVTLTEKEASELLAAAGVPMSPSRVANNKADLAECAKLTGFPVVAKISSPDILHKSDIGGVRVNVKNLDELNAAFDEIMANAKLKCPDARIDGLLVQKMAPAGTEILIGVSVDPQFGPMVMCGLGGVFVEVFKDVALYPAPFGKKEARKMLESLKSYKLLTGYRGAPPRDVEALAETMVKVSEFAAAHKDDLAELDINPVFVYERGLCAVDALIVNYE